MAEEKKVVTPQDRLGRVVQEPQAVPVQDIPEQPTSMTPEEKFTLKRLGMQGNRVQETVGKALEINWERLNLYKELDRAREHVMNSAALDLYADYSTNYDPISRATVWITSDSPKYVRELTDMLDRIGIEEKIFDWAWTTGCYGDHMVKVEGRPTLGVIAVGDDEHPANVSRVDYQGTLLGFFPTPLAGVNQASENKLVAPWEYVHFRLLGARKKRSVYGDPHVQEFRAVHLMSPDERQITTKYGTSLLQHALPIYKRLRLAEDSLLMTRLTRGILKYIWKLKVDSTNSESVGELVDEYVSLLKRARAVDTSSSTGPKYDDKFGAMGSIEDILLPVWGDVGDLTYDEIGGKPDIRWIVDIKHLRDELACALRVPPQLLGGYVEEASGALGAESLTKLDIRFARNARRLQRSQIHGIKRICQIHLAFMGMDPDPDLFDVNMSSMSTAEEEHMRESLDLGTETVEKFMDMVDQLGVNIDKVKALDYFNQKLLKLNDFNLEEYLLDEPQLADRLPFESTKRVQVRRKTKYARRVENLDLIAPLPGKSYKKIRLSEDKWRDLYAETVVKWEGQKSGKQNLTEKDEPKKKRRRRKKVNS